MLENVRFCPTSSGKVWIAKLPNGTEHIVIASHVYVEAYQQVCDTLKIDSVSLTETTEALLCVEKVTKQRGF